MPQEYTQPTKTPVAQCKGCGALVRDKAAHDKFHDAAVGTTTPPQPPTGSNPSGQPLPADNVSGWRLIFADDFTTPVPLGQFPQATGGKWGAYLEGWRDTSKNGVYSPGRVLSVHDSVLDYWIRTEAGVPLVSVPYPKLPGATPQNGMPSGRYVARFKSDPLPGYKTAWLLWPDSETWPRDGEIDFPEGNLHETISGFVHYQNGTHGGDQYACSSSERYNVWHTAVIEWWGGSRVKFWLDDTLVGETTTRVPNTTMHWVLQTETNLDGYKPDPNVAGHLLVDWVAVYRPA